MILCLATPPPLLGVTDFNIVWQVVITLGSKDLFQSGWSRERFEEVAAL